MRSVETKNESNNNNKKKSRMSDGGEKRQDPATTTCSFVFIKEKHAEHTVRLESLAILHQMCLFILLMGFFLQRDYY